MGGLYAHLFVGRQVSLAGLKVEMLEDKQSLQDAVLSLHHACMLTMSQTGAFKIIENQKGAAFIQAAHVAQVVQAVKCPMPQPFQRKGTPEHA
jgi:hypothetical protein